VELSDTVIAQCSNFLIFKMTHPKDIKYIEEMLPNISTDIIEKQKTLQPGNCVGFGSAFKIPMIVHMEIPNPAPYSSNCDVTNSWQNNNN
jgi:DNA helicase HerA-like ATPase